MSLVLINAYSGNLISYLSVPKLKPVVQSFENLASSLDLKLAIDANSVMANRLLVSEYITIQTQIKIPNLSIIVNNILVACSLFA